MIINEPIRALSWKQPYADLMLKGKVETRPWGTKYRGLVLICASQKPYPLDKVLEISGEANLNQFSMDLSLLNGQAIAVARLIDCTIMTQENYANHNTYVKYRDGLYLHVYDGIIPIKPFPIKGKQRWFNLTDDQLDKIRLDWGKYPETDYTDEAIDIFCQREQIAAPWNKAMENYLLKNYAIPIKRIEIDIKLGLL